MKSSWLTTRTKSLQMPSSPSAMCSLSKSMMSLNRLISTLRSSLEHPTARSRRASRQTSRTGRSTVCARSHWTRTSGMWTAMAVPSGFTRIAWTSPTRTLRRKKSGTVPSVVRPNRKAQQTSKIRRSSSRNLFLSQRHQVRKIDGTIDLIVNYFDLKQQH